jgi:hypothetical protein
LYIPIFKNLVYNIKKENIKFLKYE